MRSWHLPPALRRAAVPARWAVAAGILVLVIEQTGSRPFTQGLAAVSPSLILVGAAVAAVTTVCVAARWCQVTRALGGTLELSTAVGAYYRSQFLNVVLPTGVLGDAHRAVAHGPRLGGLGRSARTVAWDRVWGQAVQLAVTCALLAALPSPLHGLLPEVVGAGVLIGAVVAVAVAWMRHRHEFARRTANGVTGDLRRLLARDTWPRTTTTSLAALVGHVGVFLLAMSAVGVTTGLGIRLGLALLVLAAMSIPLSIAGWGPREGVALWAFGAAGLGGSTGVAVTTVYAVLVLCGLAPGALLLAGDLIRSHPRQQEHATDSPSMRADSDPHLEVDRG